MARYEHLPIYKKALDTAVYFEKVVSGFSRYHKYTLGTELRNKSREIVSLIVKANSVRDKLPLLLSIFITDGDSRGISSCFRWGVFLSFTVNMTEKQPLFSDCQR